MKNLYRSVIGLAVVGLVTTMGPGQALAMRHHVPRVETYAATNITSTSVVLNGWVRGIGSGKGVVWFEYGTNPYSGNYQTSWPFKAGVRGIVGATADKHSVFVTGLKPNTTYYYFIKAENANGNNRANIMSFTTKK